MQAFSSPFYGTSAFLERLRTKRSPQSNYGQFTPVAGPAGGRGNAVSAGNNYGAAQQECRTVQEQQCNTVQEQQCDTVNRQQCNTIQEQQCSTVQERQCNTVQERQCNTVQEQQCQTVQEQQCQTVTDTVNEQQCSTVQEQQCSTVTDTVNEQVCLCYNLQVIPNLFMLPVLGLKDFEVFEVMTIELKLFTYPKCPTPSGFMAPCQPV